MRARVLLAVALAVVAGARDRADAPPLRVLVTGVTGMIGSNVAAKLLAHEPLGGVPLPPMIVFGMARFRSDMRMFHALVPDESAITLLRGDLDDPLSVALVVRRARPDVSSPHAAPPSMPSTMQSPVARSRAAISARAASVIHHQYLSGSANAAVCASARSGALISASGGAFSGREVKTHSVPRAVSRRVSASSAFSPAPSDVRPVESNARSFEAAFVIKR